MMASVIISNISVLKIRINKNIGLKTFMTVNRFMCFNAQISKWFYEKF